MGVVSGGMYVDGRLRNSGFQRKTGYVQQQDLHLATTTVREALIFSALLRQPKSVPRKEKIAYVEEVIKILEMGSYADAVVGVPGEGKLISKFPFWGESTSKACTSDISNKFLGTSITGAGKVQSFCANICRTQCRATETPDHSS